MRVSNDDKVLNIIKEMRGCHTFAIACHTGIKQTTVSAVLTRLKNKRLIEKQGVGKATIWVVRK